MLTIKYIKKQRQNKEKIKNLLLIFILKNIVVYVKKRRQNKEKHLFVNLLCILSICQSYIYLKTNPFFACLSILQC